MRKGRAAGVGEVEPAGRATPSAPRFAGDALLDAAGGDEGVQVPADGGRRDAQPCGELRGGLRSVLEQQRAHPFAGASVIARDRRARLNRLLGCPDGFHNTIVS
jgi:hypothetical protein